MLKRIMLVAVLALCFACSAFAAEAKNPVLVLETSQGNVKVELFEKQAPITVKNFLEYAKSGFYDGTIFHRVIPSFMIQGGGFNKEMIPKATRAPIKNEANNGLKNDRGTLAMARTGMVDSATAQFFINVVNNNYLNHNPAGGAGSFGYAVFGKVLEGMDVVDKIAGTPTGVVNGMPNVPVTPVVIKSVKVLK
ncbi:peptidyl-prolyl cis-trans isomerase [Geoanaerobacter pelophilus]|uniref:Peptidyl-prolyl cis-trans isomerase n=1 Tax=Geoanaerobacter pelophilus TaxID=60036 RepID=A0ABQ0MMV8_9BACT|nr:peptidylprolyl isomerase [Geoanaerobacter pelophilus]GAW68415.1 peptidyl-prolyl cis-trans isomerase [Geoanaerobacter pelophilus]